MVASRGAFAPLRARIGAQHQRPEFDDWRGLTRHRRARDEVVSVVVGVRAPAALTEDRRLCCSARARSLSLAAVGSFRSRPGP